MRQRVLRSTPGKPGHLRSLLIFVNEVARNAVAEVQWRRSRERHNVHGASTFSSSPAERAGSTMPEQAPRS
jgi:hypothetical protein